LSVCREISACHHPDELLKAIEPGIGVVDPLVELSSRLLKPSRAAFRAFRRLLILYRRHLSPFALAALVATRASSNSSIPARAS
jgi:hypothetical protein